MYQLYAETDSKTTLQKQLLKRILIITWYFLCERYWNHNSKAFKRQQCINCTPKLTAQSNTWKYRASGRSKLPIKVTSPTTLFDHWEQFWWNADYPQKLKSLMTQSIRNKKKLWLKTHEQINVKPQIHDLQYLSLYNKPQLVMQKIFWLRLYEIASMILGINTLEVKIIQLMLRKSC